MFINPWRFFQSINVIATTFPHKQHEGSEFALVYHIFRASLPSCRMFFRTRVFEIYSYHIFSLILLQSAVNFLFRIMNPDNFKPSHEVHRLNDQRMCVLDHDDEDRMRSEGGWRYSDDADEEFINLNYPQNNDQGKPAPIEKRYEGYQ